MSATAAVLALVDGIRPWDALLLPPQGNPLRAAADYPSRGSGMR